MARTSAPLQLAALAPADQTIGTAAPLPGNGPFGLATDTGSPFAARWASLQPLLSVESQILALCRSNPGACPAPAARFAAIVEAARARNGRARIGEVNRAVNLAIRPLSDLAQYGVPEYWASPLTTFASGAGDCDDYAIAKYIALREAGMGADELRLVILRGRGAASLHMVVAARIDGTWFILDNRTMTLVPDSEAQGIMPIAALDAPAAPAFAIATATAQTAAAPLDL